MRKTHTLGVRSVGSRETVPLYGQKFKKDTKLTLVKVFLVTQSRLADPKGPQAQAQAQEGASLVPESQNNGALLGQSRKGTTRRQR